MTVAMPPALLASMHARALSQLAKKSKGGGKKRTAAAVMKLGRAAGAVKAKK